MTELELYGPPELGPQLPIDPSVPDEYQDYGLQDASEAPQEPPPEDEQFYPIVQAGPQLNHQAIWLRQQQIEAQARGDTHSAEQLEFEQRKVMALNQGLSMALQVSNSAPLSTSEVSDPNLEMYRQLWAHMVREQKVRDTLQRHNFHELSGYLNGIRQEYQEKNNAPTIEATATMTDEQRLAMMRQFEPVTRDPNEIAEIQQRLVKLDNDLQAIDPEDQTLSVFTHPLTKPVATWLSREASMTTAGYYQPGEQQLDLGAMGWMGSPRLMQAAEQATQFGLQILGGMVEGTGRMMDWMTNGAVEWRGPTNYIEDENGNLVFNGGRIPSVVDIIVAARAQVIYRNIEDDVKRRAAVMDDIRRVQEIRHWEQAQAGGFDRLTRSIAGVFGMGYGVGPIVGSALNVGKIAMVGGEIGKRTFQGAMGKALMEMSKAGMSSKKLKLIKFLAGTPSAAIANGMLETVAFGREDGLAKAFSHGMGMGLLLVGIGGMGRWTERKMMTRRVDGKLVPRQHMPKRVADFVSGASEGLGFSVLEQAQTDAMWTLINDPKAETYEIYLKNMLGFGFFKAAMGRSTIPTPGFGARASAEMTRQMGRESLAIEWARHKSRRSGGEVIEEVQGPPQPTGLQGERVQGPTEIFGPIPPPEPLARSERSRGELLEEGYEREIGPTDLYGPPRPQDTAAKTRREQARQDQEDREQEKRNDAAMDRAMGRMGDEVEARSLDRARGGEPIRTEATEEYYRKVDAAEDRAERRIGAAKVAAESRVAEARRRAVEAQIAVSQARMKARRDQVILPSQPAEQPTGGPPEGGGHEPGTIFRRPETRAEKKYRIGLERRVKKTGMPPELLRELGEIAQERRLAQTEAESKALQERQWELERELDALEIAADPISNAELREALLEAEVEALDAEPTVVTSPRSGGSVEELRGPREGVEGVEELRVQFQESGGAGKERPTDLKPEDQIFYDSPYHKEGRVGKVVRVHDDWVEVLDAVDGNKYAVDTADVEVRRWREGEVPEEFKAEEPKPDEGYDPDYGERPGPESLRAPNNPARNLENRLKPGEDMVRESDFLDALRGRAGWKGIRIGAWRFGGAYPETAVQLAIRSSRVSGNAEGLFKIFENVARTKKGQDALVATHEWSHAMMQQVFMKGVRTQNIMKRAEAEWQKLSPEEQLEAAHMLRRYGGGAGSLTQAQLFAESFAEWHARNIWGDPSLRKEAPRLSVRYDAWLRNQPKLLPQYQGAQRLADLYTRQGARDRVQMLSRRKEPRRAGGLLKGRPEVRKILGGSMYERAMRATEETIWDPWVKGMFDETHMLKKSMRRWLDVSEIDPRSLSIMDDPTRLMDALAMTAAKNADSYVTRGAHNLGFKRTGESMLDILKEITARMGRFDIKGKRQARIDFIDLLVSTRALELIAKGKEQGRPKTDFLQAKKEILEAHPEFAGLAKRMKVWSDGLIDILMEAGNLTSAEVTALKEYGTVYIPFQRAMEGAVASRFGRGVAEKGKGLKGTTKEGTREILDPVEAMMETTRQYFVTAHQEMVMKALYKLTLTGNVGGLATRVERKNVPENYQVDQVFRKFREKMLSG
ncbi:MAG TPA: hypothetical protein VM285_12235, partial [Polyangia bacterium]|nr:hypothetical protein [Polyangia bacterium]